MLTDTRLFGEQLIARGLISTDQLHIALREQQCSRWPLGRQLVRLGFIEETAMLEQLATTLGLPHATQLHACTDAMHAELLGEAFLRQHRIVPFTGNDASATLHLACADPASSEALAHIAARITHGTALKWALASEQDIDTALDSLFGLELAIDGILSEIETGITAPGAIQPVIRLVDCLLADAVKRKASDIHFEPEAGYLRIRYRIDGLLHQVRVLHKSFWPAMLVRLKVIAGLDIADNRNPQDGHLAQILCGRTIDFRVATHPTLHGENLVLRILDRQQGVLPLDELGLAAPALQALRKVLARPEGLVLVTGPTGSGKTTTLYSMLRQLDDESLNIMTLEDPVEYPMSRVRQSAVGEGSRIDFSSGVRALLRQDPDVILIGEIRDADTAAMALRAAMTGHLVLATLHANSALGALARLHELGVDRLSLSGILAGLLAQRLVRRLCPHCARAAADKTTRLVARHAPALNVREAAGCPMCAHTGYRGRLALMEVLRIDAALDDAIVRGATPREISQAASAQGFAPLALAGLREVGAGHTSLAELQRVVSLDDYLEAED